MEMWWPSCTQQASTNRNKITNITCFWLFWFVSGSYCSNCQILMKSEFQFPPDHSHSLCPLHPFPLSDEGSFSWNMFLPPDDVWPAECFQHFWFLFGSASTMSATLWFIVFRCLTVRTSFVFSFCLPFLSILWRDDSNRVQNPLGTWRGVLHLGFTWMRSGYSWHMDRPLTAIAGVQFTVCSSDHTFTGRQICSPHYMKDVEDLEREASLPECCPN